MVSKKSIDDFLAQKKLAFVGVSRKKGQLANAAFQGFRQAGYELFPVHPELAEIDGVRCWKSLAEVPEKVGGLIAMVAPARAEAVAREASAAHIPRIWFQQQGSSAAALDACAAAGIEVVHDECVLMFMPGTGFPHRVHRFFKGVFGGLPR